MTIDAKTREIIEELKICKWMSAGKLADRLNTDPDRHFASPQEVAAMTKRLDAMVDKGYLFPAGGRETLYRLTEMGKALK